MHIGNGTGFTLATLTAGTGIAITNTAGAISIANASSGVNVQTFTSSGTWTKPSLAAGSRVFIQAWGGGGSGSKYSSGGGGGGGGYNERWLNLSDLGATETITVGAGGAASTTATGNTGGTSTAGSWVSAYGGGGGSGSSGGVTVGGGGGGQLGPGAPGSSGLPSIVASVIPTFNGCGVITSVDSYYPRKKVSIRLCTAVAAAVARAFGAYGVVVAVAALGLLEARHFTLALVVQAAHQPMALLEHSRQAAAGPQTPEHHPALVARAKSLSPYSRRKERSCQYLL